MTNEEKIKAVFGVDKEESLKILSDYYVEMQKKASIGLIIPQMGPLAMAINALKRQIPQKVMPYHFCLGISYACPSCCYPVSDDDMDYCPVCGQALDWSEVED